MEMEETDGTLSAVARRAATVGGAYARRAFRRPLDVEYKRDAMDAVTAIDRETQRRVVEVLRRTSEVTTVVGEEAAVPGTLPEGGTAWVVDPIDGTNNFVRGSRLWGTAVALVRDGEPALGVTHLPVMGDTYATVDGAAVRNGTPVGVSDRTALEAFTVAPVFGLNPAHRAAYLGVSRVITERFGDLRRMGSAQLALAMVAAGELDAVVAPVPLDPWDTVAGACLVRAAGGRVTDHGGDPWTPGSDGLVATNGRRHDAVLGALQDAEPGV